MVLIICPHCGVKVIPSADDVCPSCRKDVSGTPPFVPTVPERDDTAFQTQMQLLPDDLVENEGIEDPTGEFGEIRSDYIRHRTTVGGLREAIGLCVASMGLSLFDIAVGFVSFSRPARPSMLEWVVFCLAMGALTNAWHSVARTTTLTDGKRRVWHRRLVITGGLTLLLFLACQFGFLFA